MSATGSNELKRNALGLSSALAMSLAFIAPTIGIIFISALVSGEAGVASPFVYMLGTVGIGLMAFTLAEFSRRVTTAGGFYKFITLSLGDRAGFVSGMMLFVAYGLVGPLNVNLFGGFVSGALHENFGIDVPWWILMTGVVVVVGGLSWYSVHASMQFDIAFLIAEVGVAAVVLVIIIAQGGDSGQVPEAFSPLSASNGMGGLGTAFVFVVFAFLGFESCLTVAEETTNPKRNLPLALVGSVVIAGAFYTFSMYGHIVGFGAENIDEMSASAEPLRDLGVRYIGPWYGLIIDVAAFSAIVAVLLAAQTANFRILYALGRDGLLPKVLGRTHPKYKTPHISIICFSLLTLSFGIVCGAVWGPVEAFGYLGYLACMMILPIYILTNIALPVFIKKRFPDDFSFMRHILLPGISSIIFALGLYLNVNPWPTGPVASFPIVVVVLVVAIIVWAFWLKKNKPEMFERLGSVMLEESDPLPKLEDIDPFVKAD